MTTPSTTAATLLSLASHIVSIAEANSVGLYKIGLVFEHCAIYVQPADEADARALADALSLETTINRGESPFYVHSGESDGVRITMYGASVEPVAVPS